MDQGLWLNQEQPFLVSGDSASHKMSQCRGWWAEHLTLCWVSVSTTRTKTWLLRSQLGPQQLAVAWQYRGGSHRHQQDKITDRLGLAIQHVTEICPPHQATKGWRGLDIGVEVGGSVEMSYLQTPACAGRCGGSAAWIHTTAEFSQTSWLVPRMVWKRGHRED